MNDFKTESYGGALESWMNTCSLKCQGRGRDEEPYESHLVTAQILVIEVLEPFTEFFIVHFFRNVCRVARRIKHLIFDIDRTVVPKSKRERVARTRIDADQITFAFQPDDCIERVFLQLT